MNDDNKNQNKSDDMDEDEKKVYIKPLSDDGAFNKGVEYFSEIFFFYGILMALAIYEIRKGHALTLEHNEKMDNYENDIIEAKKNMLQVD